MAILAEDKERIRRSLSRQCADCGDAGIATFQETHEPSGPNDPGYHSADAFCSCEAGKRLAIHNRVVSDAAGLALIADKFRQDRIARMNGPLDEMRRRTERLLGFLQKTLEDLP